MSAKARGIALSSLATLSLALLTACGSGDTSQAAADSFDAESNRGQAWIVDENSDPNILNIAAGSPDHKTLTAAVQAAELENVLVNAGPLTVFAPTDAAFAELPEGTVENLLKPENKQTLANIVTSHAAPGKFTLELLKDAKILGRVVATDGLVHVVDKVFLVAAG